MEFRRMAERMHGETILLSEVLGDREADLWRGGPANEPEGATHWSITKAGAAYWGEHYHQDRWSIRPAKIATAGLTVLVESNHAPEGIPFQSTVESLDTGEQVCGAEAWESERRALMAGDQNHEPVRADTILVADDPGPTLVLVSDRAVSALVRPEPLQASAETFLVCISASSANLATLSRATARSGGQAIRLRLSEAEYAMLPDRKERMCEAILLETPEDGRTFPAMMVDLQLEEVMKVWNDEHTDDVFWCPRQLRDMSPPEASRALEIIAACSNEEGKIRPWDRGTTVAEEIAKRSFAPTELFER